MPFNPTFSQFFISYFNALFIGGFVQPCVDFQPFLGGRPPKKFNDDLKGLQRLALPVARDMAKQSVLDLIPLAGSWRIVTHFHDQAGVIREFLQFEFPQSATGPVTSSAVRRNQESFGTGVFFRPSFCHHRRIAATAKAAVS